MKNVNVTAVKKNGLFIVSAMILTGLSLNHAQANLIEDGSSFAGTYQVVENACKEKFFNVLNGQTMIADIFTFKGSPQGLTITVQSSPDSVPQEGSTIANYAVQFHGDLNLAAPNSGVTENASYVSSTEFKSEDVVHFEAANIAVQRESTDIKIDSSGNITLVSQSNFTSSRICHFIRKN